MSKRMTAEDWHVYLNEPGRLIVQDLKEILWDWQNDRVELQAESDRLRGLLTRSYEMITDYVVQGAEQGWHLPDEYHELIDELAEELK